MCIRIKSIVFVMDGDVEIKQVDGMEDRLYDFKGMPSLQTPVQRSTM